MNLAQLVLVVWISAGLCVFTGWTVRTFTTTELASSADMTSKIIWHTGRLFVWAAAVLAGTLLAAAAIAIVWRAVMVAP